MVCWTGNLHLQESVVSDYLEQHGDDIDLEFVFVSYTRMQFRVATEAEIDKHNYPDEATREANREIARRDRKTLAQWGIDAAKRVGKRAFWLDFECVRNDDGVARSTSSSEDVYRICDIVRAAHSIIIAIGPSASEKIAAQIDGRETPGYRREEVTPWLRQWGSRLWTLPELLLCPAEYRIKLYVLGDPAEPKAIAKRNFAERAWDDAEAVKELVDHFEGSAILTEIRLIEAALSCFSRRQTDQFSQGDIAYATMGLFPSRHRPQVNKEDSGFQAFAKLSLANDRGAFLSRLLCLAPRQGAPWHRIEDRWGVTLSDIYPISNVVSGAADSEAIILDGVYGATIHWDAIDAEPLFGRNAKSIVPWLMLVQTTIVIGPLGVCRSWKTELLFLALCLPRSLCVHSPRAQLVIKLVQPFSVFLISLLSSLSISGPYTHPYIPYVSEAGGAAVMFLAGLAVYKYPSQLLCTVAVCYLLSSAANLVSTSSLGNYILFPLHLVRQLGHVVQPLLWAIAVHETQTWAEALGSVSLAMIGPVIGQTILLFTSDKLKTFTVQLPLLV
ncbi:hypothetical protein LY78DRAFT_671915 [Colletotrichum sublineola]|nr:hypothetical protein LY78DRAFT_671915 [Colletotrichum sublineola]